MTRWQGIRTALAIAAILSLSGSAMAWGYYEDGWQSNAAQGVFTLSILPVWLIGLPFMHYGFLLKQPKGVQVTSVLGTTCANCGHEDIIWETNEWVDS